MRMCTEHVRNDIELFRTAVISVRHVPSIDLELDHIHLRFVWLPPQISDTTNCQCFMLQTLLYALQVLRIPLHGQYVHTGIRSGSPDTWRKLLRLLRSCKIRIDHDSMPQDVLAHRMAFAYRVERSEQHDYLLELAALLPKMFAIPNVRAGCRCCANDLRLILPNGVPA